MATEPWQGEKPAGIALNELKEAVRALAREHGFDLCRFARPKLPAVHAKGYAAWLDAGMQGSMDYMAEKDRANRRRHPETMLAGVQTVITLGMRHSPPPYTLEEAGNTQGMGVIAAYALGDDYHKVMKKRLKAFAGALDEMLGKHEQRVYVDTAPVLEHAFAEQSGLGWQGKHSLTIHRGLGSWFLLGEIFTTAAIAPDAPASNHCGTCSACIDVCPTKAIVAPFMVDARLCISYLTIEHKGFIPRPLRPLMGNRIFGCDDCQQACPWNRHARAPEPDLLAPRDENCLPDLLGLFVLDEVGFRARFRKSPVRRTGRGGLLRNIAIAMGNSGNGRYIPALQDALSDAEPLVRAHATWALGQLYNAADAEKLLSVLEQCLSMESVQEVQEELRLSIEYIKEKE